MSDLWALIYNAQALSPNVDSDGDGVKNREESISGTNPLNADSVFQVGGQRVEDGVRYLYWETVTGKQYQVEASPDLKNWDPLGEAVMGNGSQLLIQLPSAAPHLNFRIVVSDVDGDGDDLTAFEEELLVTDDTQMYSQGQPGGNAGWNDFAQVYAQFTSAGTFTFQGQTVAGQTASLAESSRFLQQATMGATYGMIEGVAVSGVSTWLEQQFQLPATSHAAMNNALAITFPEVSYPVSPYIFTWWETALTAPDVLRQRVAFALSEIFVVAQTTDELEDINWGVATYYDLLVNNAFGNYRDLLYQISTSPAMGSYLSHVKNRPTDLSRNLFPDENYAREVMQLFSIGLFELNKDGSRKKDAEGNDIPTYTNADITEFAKVFTGLTFNPAAPTNGTPHLDVDPGFTIASEEDYLEATELWMGVEMAMYEPMHETGVKKLLNGQETNGTLQQDLNAAIDNLFHHPNVGPFLGRRLIQRLVKSNPSPAYIYRVASVFENNGQGVRGDMKALIRAIFLDPEARNPSFLEDVQHGKLREPVLRHTHLLRAFRVRPSTGRYYMGNYEGAEAYAQQPMRSPSVFNFYLPDHQPAGALKDAGLVGPEFQITTSTTTIKTMNYFSRALPFDFLFESDEDYRAEPQILIDFAAEIQLIENGDLPGLIQRLDLLLTRGQMSAHTKTVLQNTLETALQTTEPEPGELVRFAVYLIACSPDFAVLR